MAFRKRLREALETNRQAWTASRRLVAPPVAAETIQRLKAAVSGSSLDPSLREELLRLLAPGESAGLKAIPGDEFRKLTGLNPTKAIRNLCLLLGVSAEADKSQALVSVMAQEEIEAAVRGKDNPFDLLLATDVASVVDVGAGDLTFAEEVVKRYLGALEQAGRDLTLHCLDRLNPQEEFSPLVQAGRERLDRFRRNPSPHLKFRFFGNHDMFDSESFQGEFPRYTIAACYGPASPTFAYEPSRVSPHAVQARLRETKGEFRRVKVKGRELLEVRHGGERLTFPPWKFDIYGPLALLDLLSRKGKLCILGAVDMEVFWEILSQLLPDEQARPRDVFFTAENVRELLGPIYEELLNLAVGERTVLKDIRQGVPRVLGPEKERGEAYGFRYVEVRRGAVFPGVPAGRTAYVFHEMTREEAPWFLTLVPAS